MIEVKRLGVVLSFRRETFCKKFPRTPSKTFPAAFGGFFI